jgi:hypothetical protein
MTGQPACWWWNPGLAEIRMVTKVVCRNPECGDYNTAKTVASVMVLGLDHKTCPTCGGPMRVVTDCGTQNPSLLGTLEQFCESLHAKPGY